MYFFALCALFLLPIGRLDAAPFEHQVFDQVLQTYVDQQGLVDYQGLQQDRGPLDAYIALLGQISPDNKPEAFPTAQDQLAYWINAYNAFVLRGVIDAYPVDSVKDIKLFSGFFNRLKFTVGGMNHTLDHIENKIIRPRFKDPRIHFAINCGASSCPPLANQAFVGPTLDSALDAGARRFAADPQHVRFDRQSNTLHLSKIMDWFKQDFIDWHPAAPQASDETPLGLVDYLVLYLPKAAADELRQGKGPKVKFNRYDWALNQQPRAAE